MKRSLLVFSALLFATAVLMPLMVTAAGKNRLTDDYWQIVSTNGMAVSNLGAFENETNLYLEKQDIADPAQAWSFIKVGEGEFNIAKPDAYKSIDNNDTGKPNGNAVIQWTTTIGNPNQTWVL